MKRLALLFLVSLIFSGAIVCRESSAEILVPGENTFVLTLGESIFNFQTEEIWGVASISQILDQEWSPSTTNQNLTLRIGGIMESRGLNGVPGIDERTYFEGGIAELWISDRDLGLTGNPLYDAIVDDGPGSFGYDADTNTWGFGDNLFSDVGAIRVATFAFDSNGALQNYELSTLGSSTALTTEGFRADFSGDNIGTRGLLNLVDNGDPWADLFKTGGYYGSDMFFEASNEIQLSNPWNVKLLTGSATAQVVPEPGSALLLGAGLVFMLAGVRRKKN